MLTFIFSIWMILTDVTSIVADVQYEFVTEGETVMLPCNASIDEGIDWYGPAHNDSNPTPVETIDTYGNRVYWNVSKYSDDLIINPILPHYHRLRILNVTTDRMFYLQIRNTSIFDDGLYICQVTGRQMYILQIRYPPTFGMDTYKTYIYSHGNRVLACQPEGLPTNYSFYDWEHKSQFGQHIRFLNSTDNGSLTLPNVAEQFRYQDTGVYICNVSNGIPDSKGKYFQQGKINVISEGLPVYVKYNNDTQFGVTGHHFDMAVIVYSLSDITCKQIVDRITGKTPSGVNNIEEKNVMTLAVFHDTNINVNGTKIVFQFKNLTIDDFKTYNITVCNKYGSRSFFVELKDDNRNVELIEKKITVPIIVVVCLVITLVISSVTIKVAWKKYKYRIKDQDNQGYENENSQHTYHEIDDSQMSNWQQSSSRGLNDYNFANPVYCNSLDQLERHGNYEGSYHSDEHSSRQITASLETQQDKTETESISSSLDLGNDHSSSCVKDVPEIKTLVEVHNASYGQSDDLKSLSDGSNGHPYNSILSNYPPSIKHRYENVEFHYENIRTKATMDN